MISADDVMNMKGTLQAAPRAPPGPFRTGA